MAPRRSLITRSLAATLALTALGFSTVALAQIAFRAIDLNPIGHPTIVALESMGWKLEAATSGRLQIQLVPAASVANAAEAVAQAADDEIQLVRAPLELLAPSATDAQALALPFAFRNAAQWQALIDGAAGVDLLQRLSPASSALVALAWIDVGGQVLLSRQPLRRVDDLRGLRVGTPGPVASADAFAALGARTVRVDRHALLESWQGGALDAVEVEAPGFDVTAELVASGARCITTTLHAASPSVLAMSRAAWERLSPHDQALMRHFAREAQLEARRLWAAWASEGGARLVEMGVETTELDPRSVAAAADALQARGTAMAAGPIDSMTAAG